LLLDVVLNTNTAGCALVGGGCGTSAHKGSDHDRCVNGTIALSAAERSSLSALDVAVTNDCSVRLGSAAAKVLSAYDDVIQPKGNSLGRAVTGSSVLDGQTGHADSIGTLDLCDDAVGRSASCNGSDQSDLLREIHIEKL
jgi:hypothetical protein